MGRRTPRPLGGAAMNSLTSPRPPVPLPFPPALGSVPRSARRSANDPSRRPVAEERPTRRLANCSANLIDPATEQVPARSECRDARRSAARPGARCRGSPSSPARRRWRRPARCRTFGRAIATRRRASPATNRMFVNGAVRRCSSPGADRTCLPSRPTACHSYTLRSIQRCAARRGTATGRAGLPRDTAEMSPR